MRRIWDFKITNGSFNASKPVKVRFYYRQEEKDAINNAANAFKSSCGGFIEDFEWFKTGAGIEYIPTNPSQINPDKITAGYSETGCQGSPLFGSIDGCDVITASDSLTSCNGIRYVELGQIFNFSGGTGATGVGPYDDVSPLPIELVSFIGYHNADNYTNNLNWVTAAEINSSRFVVEKSLDGASFSYLDEKPAAGNSITALSYNLVDTKPSLGDNYYRLKMIDKDGTFEYSRIINVNVGVGDAGSQILGIYPNPTRGMLNIRFLSGEKENFTMRVMNTTGQLVRENTFEFSAGINFIELNTFDFADGLYILQFVGENSGLFDGKFVKE
ncbi:MAG: T9SS type A sorting domain-containing protein [Bacteroidetes bacterium]|nr:T9SS type A sorting domain-containing protein [Bacteroidota bacterium]